jgi:predicted AAA+ superfamily ATPase
MLSRDAISQLAAALKRSPAVALLGPRQVGKTTLAKQLAQTSSRKFVYLDLQDERDRVRLTDPNVFFKTHQDTLIVLDEVQYAPDIFRHLRPEIDRDRSKGRFLLLGSASLSLLKQSAESLAGRLAIVDLGGLRVQEIEPNFARQQQLWLRGGFPESFTAVSDEDSFEWRLDFMRLLLERDLPQFGVQIAAPTLQRFWRMVANTHGELTNMSQLAASMGISVPTVNRYLDLLEAARMLRRLQPMHVNLNKRLVKTPKTYVRDSGLLHALLGIQTIDDLLSNPVMGYSWEGFVLEHVCQLAPRGAELMFYRTAAGAEMDVVVQTGSKTICFEIKSSSAPKVTQGFHNAIQDLKPTRIYIVAQVESRYAFSENIEVIPLLDIAAALA